MLAPPYFTERFWRRSIAPSPRSRVTSLAKQLGSGTMLATHHMFLTSDFCFEPQKSTNKNKLRIYVGAPPAEVEEHFATDLQAHIYTHKPTPCDQILQAFEFTRIRHACSQWLPLSNLQYLVVLGDMVKAQWSTQVHNSFLTSGPRKFHFYN